MISMQKEKKAIYFIMWNSTVPFHFWGVLFKLGDLVRIFENEDMNIMMLDFATHMKSGTVLKTSHAATPVSFSLFFNTL